MVIMPPEVAWVASATADSRRPALLTTFPLLPFPTLSPLITFQSVTPLCCTLKTRHLCLRL
jgi:hypothetical protein